MRRNEWLHFFVGLQLRLGSCGFIYPGWHATVRSSLMAFPRGYMLRPFQGRVRLRLDSGQPGPAIFNRNKIILSKPQMGIVPIYSNSFSLFADYYTTLFKIQIMSIGSLLQSYLF